MQKHKNIHIGFSHLDTFLWAIVVYAMKEKASTLGIRLTISNFLTLNDQAAGIENLIKQKVDALIVSPMTSNDIDLISTIKKANAANIPVVVTGSEIGGGSSVCFVGCDNLKAQTLITEYLFKFLGGQGKIAQLRGRPQLNSHVLRAQAVYNVLNKYPDIHLVFEGQHSPELSFEEMGRDFTRQIIAEHPDLNAIITATDRIALGAIEAVEEAGLSGKISIISFDGIPQALHAIKAGKLLATVSQNAQDIAENALLAALDSVEGKKVPDHILTGIELITSKNIIDAALTTIDCIPSILGHMAEVNAKQRQLQQQIITSQYKILQTTAAISHAVRDIPESDLMTQEIVNLIRAHFNFAFVGLFLLDENEHILLSAKSGTPSAKFENKIDITLSPTVGWCVLNKKVQAELDKAELVLPLSIAEDVIGVLAIQGFNENAFIDDNVKVLQTMADQAAIALQNAKLYKEQQSTLLFLDSVIDNLPVGLSIKDTKDLTYVLYNKASEELYGINRKDIIGKTAHDCFPKETADAIIQADRQVAETHKAIDIPEETIHTKDNLIKVLHKRKLPILDSDGNPKFLLSIAEDITDQKRSEEALRASELRFRSLTELSSDWYWEQDENYRFVEISGGDKDSPLNDHEDLGKTRWELPYIGVTDAFWKQHKKILEERKPFHNIEFVRLMKDGILRHLSISGSPIFDKDQNFKGYRGVGKEITKQKKAEEALRESEERFRSLTELSSDWYWEQDENYRFVGTSGGDTTSPLRDNEDIGKTRWELPTVGVDEETWNQHKKTLEERRRFYNFEFARKLKDGNIRYIRVSGYPIFDKDQNFKGYRGVGKDITEKKLSEERIQFLAYHDGLTSLPNRSRFTQQVNHALIQAKRYKKGLAILFIDLDRFKNINDALGHEAGDSLLQEIANRLKTCLRQGDTVARLGGDEFVVLLEEVNESKYIANVARKILSNIVQPISIMGSEFQITASIGISIYPEDGEDEQTLTKNADIAMYLAKEQGKNNYQFYSSQTNVHSFERLALESNLRRALQNNEFLVYYQPKIDINTNQITGMEALVRWQHPDLGLVAPAQFIPLAEETGLIVPIGKWVLKTACEQNVAWRKEGFPKLRVAVNLSPRQFGDENLINDVKVILDQTGMEPALLELEITESMVMYNTEKAIKLVRELKKMGIFIAIDDFGTGYSSLALLKKFPIDTIKIDRSFIKDLPNDQEDTAITDAIINMGKALHLNIVAEGVEKKEQLGFLRDHNCNEMQGFYFSKPIPYDEFVKLLNKKTPKKSKAPATPVKAKQRKKPSK